MNLKRRTQGGEAVRCSAWLGGTRAIRSDHHGKPMNASQFLNLLRHRKIRQGTPIREIYHRVADVQLNLVVTEKLLDRLRKRWGNTLPNHQRIIVGEHHPLARRIWNAAGQLRKTHVIHSMNELLDLCFHNRGGVLPPNDVCMSHGGHK